MAKKRLTKQKSEAIRQLLDRWYMSYNRIGYEGPVEVFGMPLSQINTRRVADLWIDNIKEAYEQDELFDEDLKEDIEYVEELYNNTID